MNSVFVLLIITTAVTLVCAVVRRDYHRFNFYPHIGLVVITFLAYVGMYAEKGKTIKYADPVIVWACGPETAIISRIGDERYFLHMDYRCSMKEREVTSTGQPFIKGKVGNISSSVGDSPSGSDGEVLLYNPEIPKVE